MKEFGTFLKISGICNIIIGIIIFIFCRNFRTDFILVVYLTTTAYRVVAALICIALGCLYFWFGKCFCRDSEDLHSCYGKMHMLKKDVESMKSDVDFATKKIDKISLNEMKNLK